MSLRSVPFLLLAALAGACTPGVTVPVLQPSLVSVPPDVQTIGVIDRSKPKNVGQAVLGALEGAATGEAIQADRQGAKEALAAATSTLDASPRFKVVTPNVDRREAESTIWDKPMDFERVRAICKQAHCDALLALEAFDSDSNLNIGGQAIDPHKAYSDVTVTRYTKVMASWRLYDAHHQAILDQLRGFSRDRSWDEHGDTLAAAKRQLPSQTDTVRKVGGIMGAAYAARIAPTYIYVTRYYYGSGSPGLKEGRNHVRAHDWKGAMTIWRRLLRSPDGKIAGRAQFNLALGYEVNGDLRQALAHAKKAAVTLHNSQTRSYVFTLEKRLGDQERLQQQMAAPPPAQQRMATPPPAQPQPLAVPGPQEGPPAQTPNNPPPPPAPAPDSGHTMSRPQ